MLCKSGSIFLSQFFILLLILQVGVKGDGVVVLAVEKKSVPKLQEERTVRKICVLDDHVVMAFAGTAYTSKFFVFIFFSNLPLSL